MKRFLLLALIMGTSMIAFPQIGKAQDIDAEIGYIQNSLEYVSEQMGRIQPVDTNISSYDEFLTKEMFANDNQSLVVYLQNRVQADALSRLDVLSAEALTEEQAAQVQILRGQALELSGQLGNISSDLGTVLGAFAFLHIALEQLADKAHELDRDAYQIEQMHQESLDLLRSVPPYAQDCGLLYWYFFDGGDEVVERMHDLDRDASSVYRDAADTFQDTYGVEQWMLDFLIPGRDPLSAMYDAVSDMHSGYNYLVDEINSAIFGCLGPG